MKTITPSDLVLILERINHATPVTFTAFTDARAKKTGNPYIQIRKLSRVNGFTGFDYEASVNRQLTREGKEADFESQDRKWGEKTSACIVTKGDKKYLIVKPQMCHTPMYFGSKDGHWKHVDVNTIKPFLPAEYKNDNQGTDKEIIYRNYAIENIRQISIGGEKYILKLAA